MAGVKSFASNAYTAVDLMDFTAGARQGNVTVKWTTGTEINNAGFNIYRSSSELGARTKLNGGLIAARGDATSGGSYSLPDNPGYGTFYYWLEDVELGWIDHPAWPGKSNRMAFHPTSAQPPSCTVGDKKGDGIWKN